MSENTQGSDRKCWHGYVYTERKVTGLSTSGTLPRRGPNRPCMLNGSDKHDQHPQGFKSSRECFTGLEGRAFFPFSFFFERQSIMHYTTILSRTPRFRHTLHNIKKKHVSLQIPNDIRKTEALLFSGFPTESKTRETVEPFFPQPSGSRCIELETPSGSARPWNCGSTSTQL